MTQNNLKKTLSVVATIIAILVAGAASGTVKLPTWMPVGWLGLISTALGVFGASPIGRVVGVKETITQTPVEPTTPPAA